MRNLVTRHGELDLTIFPSGFDGGYSDLIEHAELRQVDQVHVRVAALSDVIASKKAAGRGKDQLALPELLELAKAQQSHARPAAPGRTPPQEPGRP